MRIKIFVIVFLFFVVKPVTLFSSEAIPLDSENLDSLRDPFTPQLPLPPAEEIRKPTGEQSLPKQMKSPTAEDIAASHLSSQKNPQPVAQEPLKPPETKILGVIWSTDRPQAIINGQIVKVGDQIEAWTIEKIGRDSIEISAQGKKIFIPTNFGVQSGPVKEPVDTKKQNPKK